MKTKQAEFTLNAKDRAELEKIVGDGNAPQKVAKRAKIVLMTADGVGVMAIMRTVGVSKTTVWRWQEYFVEAGVAGVIKGRSKPPGKKPIPEALKREIVEKTVKERPAHATHWSVAWAGRSLTVFSTISRLRASGIGFLPGGLLRPLITPATPASTKYSCQRQTVVLETPTVRIIAITPTPSAVISTILARFATFWGAFPSPTIFSSSARSFALSVNSACFVFMPQENHTRSDLGFTCL